MRDRGKRPPVSKRGARFSSGLWLLLVISIVGGLRPGAAFSQAEAQSPVPADATATEDHAPIVIEGDVDVCNPPYHKQRTAVDDGIRNCRTADGTAERPYVISDWRISMFAEPVCLGAVSQSLPHCAIPEGCQAVSPHRGHMYVGAVSICNTTKHFVLENLELISGSPAAFVERSQYNYTRRCAPACTLTHDLLTLWGASNVTLRSSRLTGPGLGIYVGDGYDLNGTHWPARGILLESVEMEPVHLRSLEVANSTYQHMIEIYNAEVTVRNSTIEALGHESGIEAATEMSSPQRAEASLTVVGSTITNAAYFGVRAWNATLSLRDNRFISNGVEYGTYQDPSGTAIYSGGAVDIEHGTATFEVVRNLIQMGGAGVYFDTAAAGVIDENTFRKSGDLHTTLPPPAVVKSGRPSLCLLTAIRYNDLDGASVTSNNVDCALDARHNWWGSVGGPDQSSPTHPQTAGRVTSDPWLRLPPSLLPIVKIESPAPGSEASRRVILKGTATSAPENPLVRVEARLGSTDWSTATTADGLAAWGVTMDLAGHAKIPTALWVRGCGEVECGIPRRLDLVVVDEPRAPIALLRATPDRVEELGTVRLDAGSSYSPNDVPLKEFRFDLGDGRTVDWGPASQVDVTYPTAGTYVARLNVRDADGLVAGNDGSAFITVVAGDALSRADAAGLPALGLTGLVGVLVGVVTVHRGGGRRS